MPDDFRICGTALHHMELLRAGEGDMAKGRLVLAQRHLAEEEERLGREDPRLEQAVWEVAGALAALERHEEADPFVARAMAFAERNPQDAALAHRLYNQALGDSWRGQNTRAEALLDWALRIHATLPGQPYDLSSIVATRADVLRATGRLAEAEAEYRRALAVARSEQKGRGWVGGAMLLRKIALVCMETGKLVEAEVAFDAGIAEEGAVLGPDYWEVTEMRDERAELYRRRGQEARARAEETEVLRLLEEEIAALDSAKMDAESIARLRAKREARIVRIQARRRN